MIIDRLAFTVVA